MQNYIPNFSKNKKGAGLISGLVLGVAGLVILVIIAFVIVSTLNNSNLLTAASSEANATTRLIGNFTSGIDNVSGKIPTVLLVAAIVLILTVLGLLVAVWRKMGMGGGSSGGSL